MIIEQLIRYFEQLTLRLPLELIAFVGSFVEEIISPLPSFIVLVPVGAAASAQEYAVWCLAVLALCSAFGRLPAALLLYWFADRFEDVVLKHRNLFGVTHSEIERFGKRLGKSGRRDWVILFLMNGLPVFPTMVLSLACGFVKVPKRMFVTTVFAGSILNALCYLGIGYVGIRVAETLSGLELAGQLVGGALLLAGVWWLIWRQHRKRRTTPRV